MRRIAGLEREIHVSARQDEEARRLMSVPGIGPISAMAIQAFAPPMESFRRGRDFSAWLGLVPRQHTTGGKPKLGKISKMGQRDLRRLLITGRDDCRPAGAVPRGVTTDPWLAGMLARKPRMLVAVVLANRMARIVWALLTTKESYRASRRRLRERRSAGSRRGCGQDGGQVRAKVNETGSGKPASERESFQARVSDLDPIRASPYGPAGVSSAA